MEGVAKAAGTSRPLVHSYFTDRRGLLDAIHIRIIRRLDDWVFHGLERADTTHARIAALVNGVMSFIDQESQAWGILSTSGGYDHPAFHRLRARWVDSLVDGNPDRMIPAQVVVSALVLTGGSWVTAGTEPVAVVRVLAPLVTTATAPTGWGVGGHHLTG